MNATAISRVLRKAGFTPVPTHTHDREGLRVTNSTFDRVRVTADLDQPNLSIDMAANARDALVAAGYQVVETSSPDAFYVTGRR